MAWTFAPRWKEELVCSCSDGELVLELTMGVLTVYLPTMEKWQRSAPEWARARYEELRGELSTWCREQKIPMVVDESAGVFVAS